MKTVAFRLRLGLQHARLGVLLLPLALGGCARMMHSHDLAPSGLTRTEDGWRSMLVAGRGDSVATRIARGGNDVPGDELLRLLYLGAAAHYSGAYVESSQYLEAAAALSDDRITKSISRSVLSLISNDGVLPYAPAHTERLLIPYYAALNYIALGRMEDAAVEARRLAALLQNENTTDDSDDVRRVRAALRSFTGSVFEATGSRNDALVAYRNAAALGAAVDTASLSGPGTADSTGVVMVLLESGFVAHRVEQNLFVWLADDELYAFSSDTDDGDRAQTASGVATRVISHALGPDRDWRGHGRGDLYIPLPPDRPRIARQQRAECDEGSRGNRSNDDGARKRGDHDDGAPPSVADALKRGGLSGRVTGTTESRDTATATAAVETPASAPPNRCREEDHSPYLLKVAWPVYRESNAAASASIIAGTDTVLASFADLSGAVVHDYNSQLPLIVARTVARGAAKAALTQSAKRKASEQNRDLGRIIGLLGNVGNVILERADTRSWHLLPAGVAVVRVRMPAGVQHVSVTLPGQATMDLGTVNVEPGRISFLSRRAW